MVTHSVLPRERFAQNRPARNDERPTGEAGEPFGKADLTVSQSFTPGHP
jgi:hypothetical protein